MVKVHFVLGNEAHCLLDTAGAPAFAKDSSILAGHDCVSILPCSVVLTGGRHGLDVASCSDGVALVEFGVHVQVSTSLEATLKGKGRESEHIASPLVSTGLTCTGALSLHISYCLLTSNKGMEGKKNYIHSHSSGVDTQSYIYLYIHRWKTAFSWKYFCGIASSLLGYLQYTESCAKSVPLC